MRSLFAIGRCRRWRCDVRTRRRKHAQLRANSSDLRKRIPLAMWKPGPCGVGRKKVPCAAPRAPVSRNYPCECPSCIGYNSVLPSLFPTDNMSARTSTLGRWSTRQRQRPALPEAELGWQIESTCLTLAPTSPVSAHGFRAAPPPRSDPSLTVMVTTTTMMTMMMIAAGAATFNS